MSHHGRQCAVNETERCIGGKGGSAESCHGVCLCVLQCFFKPSHRHTPTRFVNESGRDSHSQTQERREGGRVGGSGQATEAALSDQVHLCV